MQSIRSFLSLSFILLFLTACSNNKANPEADGKDSSGKTGTETILNYEAFSTDVCDCLSNLENDLSDRMKDLVIESAKAGNPNAALKDGLHVSEDSMDRVEMDEEYKKLRSKEVRDCLRLVEKKYPGIRRQLRGDSKKTILASLEEHCSPFAAAYVQWGLSAL